MKFYCGKYQLDLSTPKVMGIVNVTPDSFSDGGKFVSRDAAIEHALKLLAEGADILDIGGESTRPGALPVPLEEELNRVIPVIEAISKEVSIPISIDTYKPEVMQAAIDAGADIVNDVNALRAPRALDVVAATQAGVCLMHMQGQPQTMQQDPQYQDVVREVIEFLSARVESANQAGIDSNRIIIDPGFGFGKRTHHNIALLNGLQQLLDLNLPILVGLSRKSILGQLVGADVDARLHAGIAASVLSVIKGARILRVHDVKATVEALKLVNAVLNA